MWKTFWDLATFKAKGNPPVHGQNIKKKTEEKPMSIKEFFTKKVSNKVNVDPKPSTSSAGQQQNISVDDDKDYEISAPKLAR